MPWPPKHQTVDQFLARVKAHYAQAEGARAAAIAAWLQDAIDDGKVTDTQARQAWGQTQAQWAQAKGRMQADRQALRAVQAARGN